MRKSSCQHGRQRSQCKECGGASICQHGRVRTKCKECAAVYFGRTVAKVDSMCGGTVTGFKTARCKYTITYTNDTTGEVSKTQLLKILSPLPEQTSNTTATATVQ